MVRVTMTSSLHQFTICWWCIRQNKLFYVWIKCHPIKNMLWQMVKFTSIQYNLGPFMCIQVSNRCEGVHGDDHFMELREKQPASIPRYRYQFCQVQLPSEESQYGNGRNWHQIGCSIQRHPILDDNLMVRLTVLWP